MNNPTQQELMEFVDGTLPPQRYREIELLLSQSRQLQQELLMLKAMRRTVQTDALVKTSRNFTTGIMDEILPLKKEALWMRLAKNSSNLFAMILVLSMIAIVFVSGPAGVHSNTNLVKKSFESYSKAYNSALENLLRWTTQYSQPMDQSAKNSSGKFFILGLGIFIIYMIVDEAIGKKYFHTRMHF